MNDNELNELLAHPRVQAYIDRRAERAAVRAFAAMGSHQKSRVHPKARPAAEGDLNYQDAADFIGCPLNSIRGYVTKKRLQKGELYFTVTYASCERFKQKYKPNPNGRISG